MSFHCLQQFPGYPISYACISILDIIKSEMPAKHF